MTARITALSAVLLAVAAIGYYAAFLFPAQTARAQLDRAIASLPPGCTAHYDGVRGSLFGSFGVDGIDIKCNGTNKFDASAGTIDINGANWDLPAAWQRAVAAPSSIAPETAIPIAQTIVVRNLRFRLPIGTTSVGSLRVDGFHLFPWSLLRPGLPSLNEAQAALAVQVAGGRPQLANLRPLLMWEASRVWALAYTRAEFDDTGAMLTIPTAIGTPALTVNASLHKMTITGVERGVVAGAQADGYAMTNAGGPNTSVDTVVERDVDIRQAMTALLDGHPFDAALLDGSHIGAIEEHGITTSMPPVGKVTIDAISASDISAAGGDLASGRLRIAKLRLRRGDLPGAAKMFDALRLDAMTIGFDAAYDGDAAKHRHSLHDTRLRVDELGELDLAADSGDAGPTLDHAVATYIDNSFVNRAIAAHAGTTGEDPEVIRQALVSGVRRAAETYVESPEIAAAAEAIDKFLMAPKSLTVTLAPPQPVPMTSLLGLRDRTPAQIVANLGVTVTAGP